MEGAERVNIETDIRGVQGMIETTKRIVTSYSPCPERIKTLIFLNNQVEKLYHEILRLQKKTMECRKPID